MPLDHAAMTGHIARLETLRASRVLVLAATNLDMDLLPALHRQCSVLGPVERLDVVLHGRGGGVGPVRGP